MLKWKFKNIYVEVCCFVISNPKHRAKYIFVRQRVSDSSRSRQPFDGFCWSAALCWKMKITDTGIWNGLLFSRNAAWGSVIPWLRWPLWDSLCRFAVRFQLANQGQGPERDLAWEQLTALTAKGSQQGRSHYTQRRMDNGRMDGRLDGWIRIAFEMMISLYKGGHYLRLWGDIWIAQIATLKFCPSILSISCRKCFHFYNGFIVNKDTVDIVALVLSELNIIQIAQEITAIASTKNLKLLHPG